MWAERERQNFRSPLKPISVTPDPRSATSRSRSAPAPANFFHTRSPLRSRSPDFCPAPLLFRSAHALIYVSSSKLKKWTDFYRASSYDSAVLAVVCLYVCLSVCLSVFCHTRALWQNQTMHCSYFDTTRKGNHPGLLSPSSPTVVRGRRPPSEIRDQLLNPSKRGDFDRFLLITSQFSCDEWKVDLRLSNEVGLYVEFVRYP